MTDLNKYNPWPEEATIRCPECGEKAEFRFAFSLVPRAQWPAWEGRIWSCSRATDWERMHAWLPGDPVPSWKGWIIVEHDPKLFQWKPPPQGYNRTNDGIIRCPRCVGRRAHVLSWPEDAWYSFELRRGTLWAWSRSHVASLVNFIESSERNPAAHKHTLFLRHIPGVFLAAADRQANADAILKRLRELP